MIDDRVENLHNMHLKLEERNINFTGLYYQFDKNFHKNMVEG